MTPALLACFTLSGLCALVYQLVWTRWLGLIVGNFATATATVVTAFMAGLALGNWIIGRRASGLTPARAVRLYAILEAVLAVLAALSPALLSSSSPLYPALAGISAGAVGRAALCLLVLLPPTLLMGGTLPALVQALSAAAPAALGPLYALNTIGGAAGPLLAAFLLMPLLGLQATLWVTAAVNAAVAAVAFVVSRRMEASAIIAATPGDAPEPAAASVPAPDHGYAWWMPYALAAVSGFLSLGFEIALTRHFVLTVTGGSVYGFAIILSSYLVGLALGAALVRRYPPADARRALVRFAIAQAVVWAFALTTPFWDVLPPLLVRLWWQPLPFGALMAADFVIILVLVLVAATAFGYSLPVLAGALPGVSSAGIGRLFAANTVGAMLGAALTGFLLLVELGLSVTLLALGSISLLAAAAAWIGPQARRGTVTAAWAAMPFLLAGAGWLLSGSADPLLVLGLLGGVPAVVIAGVSVRAAPEERSTLLGFAPLPLLLLLPFALPPPDISVMNAGMYNRPLGFMPGGEQTRGTTPVEAAHNLGRIIYQKDSLTARIAVRYISPMEMSFVVNGKPDGSSSLVDMYTQIFMAHLPALMHPAPSRVLVIGLGTGTTTGCLALHPEVKEIHVAEIEPAQVDVARIFGQHNYNGVDSPKVRMHFDDARHYLLGDRTKYDVIVSEPSNLWVSGMVNLFTAEFYRSVQEHLNPGGVFFQWIHYYRVAPEDVRGMLATFTSVFPQSTFWIHQYGDAFLMGRDGGIAVDIPAWERRLASATLTQDLRRIQMIPPLQILGFLLWGPEDIARYAAGARICTDDMPYFEFTSPRVRYSPAMVAEMRIRMQFQGGPLDKPPLEPIPLVKETAALRVRLGDFTLERGSLARAAAEYRRAVQLDPAQPRARRQLAQINVAMVQSAVSSSATALEESFTR
ncbi:MAG: fused MFS/spermidine synthase [Candidatus Coatesbacteria bacterium]